MYDIIVYINENAGGFMALYTRLKDLREDKELKQSEIAGMLKISQQHYSLIETGKIETTFDKIIKLSKFYDVSIDYIAGLTNEKRRYKD